MIKQPSAHPFRIARLTSLAPGGLPRRSVPFLVPVLCAALSGCGPSSMDVYMSSQKDLKDQLAVSQKTTDDQIRRITETLNTAQTNQTAKIDALTNRLKEISDGVKPLEQRTVALENVQKDILAALQKEKELAAKIKELATLFESFKDKVPPESASKVAASFTDINALLTQLTALNENLNKKVHETPDPSKHDEDDNQGKQIAALVTGALAIFMGCPPQIAAALAAVLGGLGSSTSKLSNEEAKEIMTLAEKYKQGQPIDPKEWQRMLEILSKTDAFKKLDPNQQQLLKSYLDGSLTIPAWKVTEPVPTITPTPSPAKNIQPGT